jgi:hypothetical protein
MPARPTSAPPEKAAKTLSRLERAALAHKSAVEEKGKLEAELATVNRKFEELDHALREANALVIQTGKELTGAALEKPQ